MLSDFEKEQRVRMYKTMPYVLLRILTDLSLLIVLDGKDGKVTLPEGSMTNSEVDAILDNPNNRAKQYIGVMTTAIVMSANNDEKSIDNMAVASFVHTTIEELISGVNMFPQALAEMEAEDDEDSDDDDDDDDATSHIDECVRQAVGEFYIGNELNVEAIPRSLRQDLYAILPVIKVDDLALPQLHKLIVMVFKHQGIISKMEQVSQSKSVPRHMESHMELHLIMRNLHEVMADLLHDHAMITTPASRISPADCAKLALGMIQEAKEFGPKFVIERINGSITDTKGTA